MRTLIVALLLAPALTLAQGLRPVSLSGARFLIPDLPGTLSHVRFLGGGTNYFTASSSPCWTGNVVNSPHYLFFNMTCANDATTGPDGRTADQFTKSTTTGSFYRSLGATETVSSTAFSSTVVGRHPTATGYVGTQAACPSTPSGCTCSACTTTDGSACTGAVSCTAAISTTYCTAYAAIDNASWVRVSADATCSAPATTTTCSAFPGRPALDSGATAYITDVMCQDSAHTAYVHTAGVSGGSVTLIGSTTNMATSKGAPWVQVGGFRQNNPVATTPARVGVGPMIASYGWLEYPTASDPMDLSTWSACAVVVPSAASLASTNVLANNHQDPPVGGWQFVFYETGSARLFGYAGGVATGTVAQASAWTANVPNLACWGFSASDTTCYLRQNKGAVVSAGSCTTAPDASGKAKIGIHHDNFLPFLGTVVEYWITSEAPSQQLFDRIAKQVEVRGGLTLP